jgi:2-polyprenyl-3-methyl-5-hydroxy-6-metoxy-1,4-benzoquinol methylase
MSNQKPSLDAAYSLKSVQDNHDLYAAWAKDYDHDFASEMDYILPAHVSQIFVDVGGIGPVLDVGAGTGLAGHALAKLGSGPIDAMDLSRDMLEVAAKKGIYRNFFAADISQTIATDGETYQGIISSGTFTHGHVGPDAIDNLLPLAKMGAYFVLSINKDHWGEKGFAEKFETLEGVIENLVLHDVAIYGDNSKGDHGKDLGIAVVFQKA